MLPEIWISNLKIVFVGTVVPGFSDNVGFYYMDHRNQFWDLLEYSKIIPARFMSKQERQALRDAFATERLTDELKEMYFRKKATELLKLRLGLTDLNRRVVVSKDDDPKARPSQADIAQFVQKVEKLKPKVIAFVTSLGLFKEMFEPLYPRATGDRGHQAFRIGGSEIWLLGSTSGRATNVEEREAVFDDLSTFLAKVPGGQE